MLFRIAKENQERAAHAFTVERIAHDYGYKKSAMLYPKSNRIMHYYEIDMLDADRIICTVRHKNTDCIVALVWLSGYTPESIEVEQAELYRNCSNYPYRREYNEKYLKKYDQIACIVHWAIAAGLLFDTAEAPTTEEPSATGQDTACTDREPQTATQSAETTADDTTTAGSDTDRTEGSQQCTESAKATTGREENHASDPETTGRNGEARTARHDRTPRMQQDARKAHHQTKYPPTTTKAHTGQNTNPRLAARDGRKAHEAHKIWHFRDQMQTTVKNRPFKNTLPHL